MSRSGDRLKEREDSGEQGDLLQNQENSWILQTNQDVSEQEELETLVQSSQKFPLSPGF